MTHAEDFQSAHRDALSGSMHLLSQSELIINKCTIETYPEYIDCVPYIQILSCMSESIDLVYLYVCMQSRTIEVAGYGMHADDMHDDSCVK